MGLRSYSLALASTPTRLSAVFGGGAIDESKNIPFRQLLFSTSGADGYLGADTTVSTTTGVKVATTAPMPTALGPFDTGPVKLSDVYAVGAGSTLAILGVPF